MALAEGKRGGGNTNQHILFARYLPTTATITQKSLRITVMPGTSPAPGKGSSIELKLGVFLVFQLTAWLCKQVEGCFLPPSSGTSSCSALRAW
ncbi:Uncharacterized protein TCM_008825 [Theobroma cacao]|uniref:Uncharacterized protein n=1 Tax=Theobroma cacao TaxID=3641 RepID=A0A061E675_THECC|nr:Uncharacterized protein TCM_008825 [Theobroma cacao]